MVGSPTNYMGPWTAWKNSALYSYGTGRVVTMDDVIGNMGGLNPCTHDAFHGPDPSGTPIVITSKEPTIAGQIQTQYEGWVPFTPVAFSTSGHLASVSGLKALAIARVPASDRNLWQSFISLAEAREISDSMILKPFVSALVRYAKTVYNYGLTSGKRRLTRDVKRNLAALRRTMSPSNAKEAWETVLAGLHTASNANMEWKYGWKPMIADMQSAADSVQRLADLRTRLLEGVRVYGHATESKTSTVYSSTAVDYYALPSNSMHYFTVEKTTERHAVASIVRRLSSSDPYLDLGLVTNLDIVMRVNGLRPSLKQVWELLPMSFMIDWFWNVRSLLESLEGLEAPMSGAFVSYGGMYSEAVTTSVVCSARTTYPDIPDITNTAVGRKKTYTRALDPLTGGPAIYIPPLSAPKAVGQWFSVAQIAFQRSFS